MNRNLLRGRDRSLLVGVGSSMGDASWLLRTDGSGTFDPSCVLSSGTATWIFGDGNSQTANSASHTYSTTGNYPVSWDVPPESVTQLDVRVDGVTNLNTKPWTSLTNLYCYSNSLTSLDTFAAWTSLTTLYCYSNSLTSLDTFAAWTSLTYLHCGSNSLTSLDTFAAWTSLTTLHCYSNSLTSLDTFAEWTSLTTLHCGSNSLTSLDTFAAWTSLTYLHCGSNSLPATEIDDILTTLDAAGASNGILNYSSNPGSADVDRSGAAATSKANLITRGWVVTI